MVGQFDSGKGIIQLTKLSGNYNAGMSVQIGADIIQLTKLSGNYNDLYCPLLVLHLIRIIFSNSFCLCLCFVFIL